MTATHPTDRQLSDFLLGKLAGPDDGGVESHLAECDSCRDRAVAARADDTFTELLAAARTRLDSERASAPTPTLDAASTPPAFAPTVAWSAPGADATGLAPDVPAVLAAHPKYRVLRRLGTGGMGTVWLAEHQVMNRPVAIKVIRPDLLARPGATGRFLREVRAAARLHHPNIVTAFDAEPAGDSCLLVMEYVPGQTLGEQLEAGPLSVADACRAVRDAARGLAYAHAHGLVHRDVKPHNLIRSADGTTKVLDFGLAGVGAGEAVAAGGDGLTGAGMVVGTPDYIAPEQIADPHAADARADIYGLGCTLYHLLAGRPPMPAGSVTEKLAAQRTRPMDPIPGLPAALAAVLAKMTAKDPAARYQTADEVVAALEHCLRMVDPPRRRRRRWAVVGLAAAALILLGSVVYVTTDKGQLRIESNTDDVQVVVSRGGEEVEVIDLKTGSKVRRLRSGEYDIRLKGDRTDVKLDRGGFTLSRWGETVVKVVPLPPRLSVAVLPVISIGDPAGAKHYFPHGPHVSEAFCASLTEHVMTGLSKGEPPVLAVPGPSDGLNDIDPLVRAAVKHLNVRAALVAILHCEDAAGRAVAQDITGAKTARFVLTARLIDAETGTILWREVFREPAPKADAGRRAYQEKVAAEVAARVRQALTGSADVRPVAVPAPAPRLVQTINGPGAAQALAYTPDGRTLLVAGRGYFGAYDPATGKSRFTDDLEVAATNTPLAVSADGRTAAVLSGKFYVYDLTARMRVAVLPSRGDDGPLVPAAALTLSRDGRRLAAVIGREALYYDRDTQRFEPTRPDDDTVRLSTLGYSPDGRYLVAVSHVEPDAKTRVSILDAKTRELLGRRELAGLYRRTHFAPDGERVFVGGPALFAVLGLPGGEVVERDEDLPTRGAVLVPSPDGTLLAAAGAGGDVQIWDRAGRRVAWSWTPHPGTPAGAQPKVQSTPPRVAFAPDGQTLATAHGNQIKVWELAAGPAAPEKAILEDVERRIDPANTDGKSLPFALLERNGVAAVRFGKWLVVFEGVRCDAGGKVLFGVGSFFFPGTGGGGTFVDPGLKPPAPALRQQYDGRGNRIGLERYEFQMEAKGARLVFADQTYEAAERVQTIVVAADGTTRLEPPAKK